jgi:hypothetical protein
MSSRDDAAEVSGFRWIGASGLLDAGCVTLVRSDDRAEVVRRFGGGPAGARELSLAAAESLSLDTDSGEDAGRGYLRRAAAWPAGERMAAAHPLAGRRQQRHFLEDFSDSEDLTT